MKTRLLGVKALGSVVSALIAITIPLMTYAANAQTDAASTKTADSNEIASLKRQIYLCHHHKRRSPAACKTSVIEKRVVVEKPVIIERERIVEKQVLVDRPAVVEKQVIVESPTEMDRRIVVEHSAHRTHLLHLGIPFISLTLF